MHQSETSFDDYTPSESEYDKDEDTSPPVVPTNSKDKSANSKDKEKKKKKPRSKFLIKVQNNLIWLINKCVILVNSVI